MAAISAGIVGSVMFLFCVALWIWLRSWIVFEATILTFIDYFGCDAIGVAFADSVVYLTALQAGVRGDASWAERVAVVLAFAGTAKMGRRYLQRRRIGRYLGTVSPAAAAAE